MGSQFVRDFCSDGDLVDRPLKATIRTSMDRAISDLTSECRHEFTSFGRITAADFEILLQKLAPLISKNDTTFRKAIPAKVRLAITLRYLATGDSLRSLHDMFKISHQLISNILHDGCAAIVVVLKNEVKMPSSEEEWFQKEADFHDIFPHCLAAVACKHVVIKHGLDGKNVNIILTTLVDKNYRFVYADIGHQEANSEEHVFCNTLLFQALSRKKLNLPEASQLPDCDSILPYIFVANNAFPLQKNVMKPYPEEHQEDNGIREFNRKLSYALMVVENAFGAMSTAFTVLQRPIALSSAYAGNVVMACIMLHNFLTNSTSSSSNMYAPPGFMDTISNDNIVLGSWRDEPQKHGALRPVSAAKNKRSTSLVAQIRSRFAQYFCSSSSYLSVQE